MTPALRPVGRHIRHRGEGTPALLHKMAWKGDHTEDLTRRAISAGFLGIDTANQRRHIELSQAKIDAIENIAFV